MNCEGVCVDVCVYLRTQKLLASYWCKTIRPWDLVKRENNCEWSGCNVCTQYQPRDDGRGEGGKVKFRNCKLFQPSTVPLLSNNKMYILHFKMEFVMRTYNLLIHSTIYLYILHMCESTAQFCVCVCFCVWVRVVYHLSPFVCRHLIFFFKQHTILERTTTTMPATRKLNYLCVQLFSYRNMRHTLFIGVHVCVCVCRLFRLNNL